MKQQNIVYFFGVLFISFYSCTPNTIEKHALCAPSLSVANIENTAQAHTTEEEKEEMISLKIPMHSKQLVLNAADFKMRNLSEEHLEEIQDWWESLPKNVQTKVQNQEVDIAVVSSIITNNKAISEAATSSQIEQTGAALEKVIGSPTEMTYMVNTTVIEKMENKKSANLHADTIAKTDIILSENIAVKLSQFDLNIANFLTAKNDNENLQTLQYWWTHLPLDLQDKIKEKEVAIDFVLKPIAAVEKKQYELYPSPLEIANKMDMYFDVLHRLIGLQKTKNQEPQYLAMINKDKTPIKSNTYYQLEIQLKHNIKAIEVPTAPLSM